MKISKLTLAALALTGMVVTLPVQADVSISSGAVVPGEWNANFQKCRSYAEEHHLPLIVYWGYVKGCEYCTEMTASLGADAAFSRWCADRRPVMCMVKVTPVLDPKSGVLIPPEFDANEQAAYDFARYSDDSCREVVNYLMPMMVLYWKPEYGETVKRNFTGRGGKMPCGASSASLAMQLADSAEIVFRQYYDPVYSGGVLMSGSSPDNRLETFGAAGSWVEIPLVRTNAYDRAYVNTVKVSRSDGDVVDAWQVSWAAGEQTRFERFEIRETMPVGEVWTVSVLDAKGLAVGECALACVDPNDEAYRLTSPKNPRYLGESFDYGEWTMDLDAATNRVAASKDGGDFTLVVVGGPLWCPNCMNLETNVFDTAEFRNWTTARKVTLVTIDEPRLQLTAGTLLRHEQDAKGVCGSPYLSRKMIAATNAEEVAVRNLSLTRFVWNRSDSWRLSNPTVLLLRKDGTVLGRVANSSIRNPGDAPLVCARIEELMGMADDLAEEENGYPERTPETLSGEDFAIDRRLCVSDTKDVYRVRDFGDRVRIALSGAGTESVALRLFQFDADGNEIAALTRAADGTPSGGVVVSQSFAESDGPVYVEVSARGLSQSAVGDTTFRYSLHAEPVVELTDALKVLKPLSGRLLTHIEANRTYQLEGLAELDDAMRACLEPLEPGASGERLYQGLAEAEVWLVLKDDGVFQGRRWSNGTIGFEVTEAEVSEDCGGEPSKTVTFNVLRTGGSTGIASVLVVLDKSASTADPDRYVCIATNVLVWGSGETGAKPFSFLIRDDGVYSGPDQRLHFRLERNGRTALALDPAAAELDVRLKDNDLNLPGELAITGSKPGLGAAMTVIAEEEGTVELTVCRRNGSEGRCTGRLVMSAGGVTLGESASVTWGHHESFATNLTLSLPSRLLATTVKIAIVAEEAEVSASAGAATVLLMAHGSPHFEKTAETVDAVCSVALGRHEVGVRDLNLGGDVDLVKVAGTLADGLTVRYDAERECLVVEGTPSVTEPGDYTVTYQLRESCEGLVAEGTTLTLTFSVKGFAETVGAAVPFVMQSHDFRSVPIIASNRWNQDEEATGRLAGLMAVSLPASGRASAKMRRPGGMISYAASAWSGFDAAARTIEVRMDPVYAEDPADEYRRPMTVTVDASGRLSIAFEGLGEVAEFEDPGWSAERPATAWQGLYHVALPQREIGVGASAFTGTGYLGLRLPAYAANSGTMSYAGCLPNGKTFSGSAVLVPAGEKSVLLPFFFGCRGLFAADVCAGELCIDKPTENYSVEQEFLQCVYPAESAYPYWSHAAATVSLDSVGGYFKQDDFADWLKASTTYEDDLANLPFYAGNPGATEVRLGTVQTDADEKRLAGATPDGSSALVLRYASGDSVSSGTFFGTFRDETGVRFAYRGMVFPGWGLCPSCGPQPLRPKIPFGYGCCWSLDAEGDGEGGIVKIGTVSKE